MTAENGPCRTEHKDKAGLNLAWLLGCFFNRQQSEELECFIPAAAADYRKGVSLFDTVAEATFADENAAAPSGHEGATPTPSVTSSDLWLGHCFSSITVEQADQRQRSL